MLCYHSSTKLWFWECVGPLPTLVSATYSILHHYYLYGTKLNILSCFRIYNCSSCCRFLNEQLDAVLLSIIPNDACRTKISSNNAALPKYDVVSVSNLYKLLELLPLVPALLPHNMSLCCSYSCYIFIWIYHLCFWCC